MFQMTNNVKRKEKKKRKTVADVEDLAYLGICCGCPSNCELDTGKYISRDARRSPADSSCTWGCQGNRRHMTNHRL